MRGRNHHGAIWQECRHAWFHELEGYAWITTRVRLFCFWDTPFDVVKKRIIHRVCHACICRCIFFLLSLHTLRHDFARCLVGLSTFADKGEATVPSFLRNGALMFGILCEQNKAYSCLSWCLKISNDLSWTSGKSWLKEWKGKFGRYVSTRACASGPNVPSFGMHISHRRPSLLCRAVKIAYWDVRHSFLHLPKYFERCHICMRLDT